jgi:aminoglycoside phosphotransferase (APT) family kinase protein
MSTLGDPVADLGVLLVYWSQADDSDLRRAGLGRVVPPATVAPGFPRRAEVAAHYAERTGADVGALHWYVAFGYWKLAVVCAGIVARHAAGAMLGEGFDDIAERVPHLVTLGRSVLDRGEID